MEIGERGVTTIVRLGQGEVVVMIAKGDPVTGGVLLVTKNVPDQRTDETLPCLVLIPPPDCLPDKLK